jgi:hypothetical protein
MKGVIEMSRITKAGKVIENGVASGYKTIENGVVTGYKAVESGVVSGYKKIEDKFVDTFLSDEKVSTGETDLQKPNES